MSGGTDELDKIDSIIKIDVSSDKMLAFIVISAPKKGGAAADAQRIYEAVSNEGIAFGVLDETVLKLERSPVYGKRIAIAKGEAPVAGKDEEIVYHFPTSKELKPKELPDGTVDFKELGLVKNVRQYDVLCSKIPATEGIEGINVLGEPVPAPFGREVQFKQGQNTVVTNDKMQLIAAIDGQVDIVKDRVEVRAVLEIDGDVDYETGNIKYFGSVLVKKNVVTGFEVIADGSVTVLGCVEGGTVIAGGNITIEQGFSGMNVGRIITNGDLKCKYIQNGTVEAELNIVAGMCINSTIKAGGNCTIVGAASSVLSSHIIARHTIECMDVGSPTVAKESVLEVGIDPHTIERARQLPKEIDAIHKKTSEFEKALFLYSQLSSLGRLTPEKRAAMEKMTAEKDALQQKQIELFYERHEIEQRLLMSGYGTISISGTAFPGTVVTIGQETLVLDKPEEMVTFYRSEEGLLKRPFNKL